MKKSETVSFLSISNPAIKIGAKFIYPIDWVINKEAAKKHINQFQSNGIKNRIGILPSEFYSLPRTLSNAVNKDGQLIFGAINKVIVMRTMWEINIPRDEIEYFSRRPLSAEAEIISLQKRGDFSYGVIKGVTIDKASGQVLLTSYDTVGFLSDMEDYQYKGIGLEYYNNDQNYENIGKFSFFFRVLEWEGVWKDNIHTKYAESKGYQGGLGEFINFIDIAYLLKNIRGKIKIEINKMLPMYIGEDFNVMTKENKIIFTNNKDNLITCKIKVS